MLGTASTIDRWLLIEHDGPWGADALRDARLPGGLRAFLRRAERELGIRVLLIRRHRRSNERGTTTVAAVSTGSADPWIERAELPDPSALSELDLGPLATGVGVGWDRSDRPAFVVCTQGRRDPCCAERGRPLAAALARRHPDETWESTHVGGDRFAGNLVIFPEGLYFGRVEPDDADRVIASVPPRPDRPDALPRTILLPDGRAGDRAVSCARTAGGMGSTRCASPGWNGTVCSRARRSIRRPDG